jgi:hypothetical protein
MRLRKYNQIIEAGPSALDSLERDSILLLVFNILGEAAAILFPGGIYSPLKFFHIVRWVKLGRLMWRLVIMVYGSGNKKR